MIGKPFNSKTASAAGKKSKRKSFDAKFREMIEKKLDAKGTKKGEKRKTIREVMIDAAIAQWRSGNTRAMEYVMNRGWGTAIHKFDHTAEAYDGETEEAIDKAAKGLKEFDDE